MRAWIAFRGWMMLPFFGLAVLVQAQPLERSDLPIELDIPVFSGGYGITFYEQTARAFEALRRDVKIKIYGDPRIEDKLRIRIIDGDLPDATLSSQLLWPTLIRAGKVVDLTSRLEQPNWEGDRKWSETFLPGALETWRLDGGIYGLPFSYACWTIFYNKALFREHGWAIPRTWDEFFQLCENIRGAGIAPLSLPATRWLYPNAFLRAAFYDLAGAKGWQDLNALRPGSWLDGRYERSAAVLQRITQHYTLRGWEGETHTGAQLALFEGRAAMTVSGSWLLNEMKGKFPPGFELGGFNFPTFADGVADPTTIQTGSDCFFVFSTGNAKREQCTIDFLRFLTSRARAEAFVRQNDAPVAIRGVPREAYTPLLQDTAAMIGGAREAFNMPQTMLQPPAVRQALLDGQMRLMTGEITPREFAERLEAAAARDRLRLDQPDRVEIRHGLAATLLLLVMGVLAAALSAGAWQRLAAGRSQEKEREVRANYFTRLRAPVAAGFIGPSLVLYGSLVLAPGLAAFYWAFTRWDGLTARTWAGWFNFKWLLFETDLFWFALKNNLYLMLVPATIVLPLALGFAYLIHRGTWGAAFFRSVFLFPNLLGGIAATLLWLNAYQPHGGLINAGLVALGKFLGNETLGSFDGYPWLAQTHLYTALIPIYIWMACGFNLILFLAAMDGVDPQLYEAAELDGAPAWRQFFSITLPLIWDVVVIAAVFLVIAGLNAFEMIWLLTSQDPDSTSHTLGTLMVTSMFKEFQIGRATAIAVVLFILVLLGSAAVMRGLKRDSVEA